MVLLSLMLAVLQSSDNMLVDLDALKSSNYNILYASLTGLCVLLCQGAVLQACADLCAGGDEEIRL